MKNKTGIITGFALGLIACFLFLDRLDNFINPLQLAEDEIPPPAIVIASLFIGLLLGFAGYLIQKHFSKKHN